MIRTNSIVAVADVSVGYGSPQIPRLTASLAEHYGREAIIIEPDEADKRRLDVPPKGCKLERIAGSVHPHSGVGRREFIAAAARRINELRPEMLVLFCTYTLPVLSQLRYRPRCTVYHSLETIAAYGKLDVALNRCFADDIDVVLFPEENRARLDGRRCGLAGLPTAVVYNVSNDRAFQPVPPAERSPRILYSGTIDRDQTFAEFFLSRELQAPIDLFGHVSGRDSELLKARLERLPTSDRVSVRNALRGVPNADIHDFSVNGGTPPRAFATEGNTEGVRYHGRVPAATLKQLRGQYAYSIVIWAPANENQYYAAPNKFFDAIADGVPPIVAPHPQCKLLVDRYQCGLLMDDWSFGSFASAMKRAQELFGTAEYERMVAGCGRAVECELNWPAQFEKVKRLLPESLAQPAKKMPKNRSCWKAPHLLESASIFGSQLSRWGGRILP